MTDHHASVLGAVGDLVEDICVHVASPVNLASDTDARIDRTRGGSAANVAVAAAAIEGRSRFIGRIGADPIGAALASTLADSRVEIAGQTSGRTGTIVVLVHLDGERTMLTDRGSAHELADPDPSWLDGLHTLHVPAYSLVIEPLATTAATLIAWAQKRAVTVSIDASSTAAIDGYGAAAFSDLVIAMAPEVLFANEDEARHLDGCLDRIVAAGTTVIVHGPAEATARNTRDVVTVGATPLADVGDTTGAGDAFAAGHCCARAASAGLGDALEAGHASARRHLASRTDKA